MTAIIGLIIKALSDSMLQALIGWLQSIQEKRALVKQGQAQQAAAETAATEKAQESMATAEAQAPHSQTEVVTALKDGSF